MNDTSVYCFKCRSTNTYLSGQGYNTVQVCKDCNSEQRKPYAKGHRDSTWNDCMEGEEYESPGYFFTEDGPHLM